MSGRLKSTFVVICNFFSIFIKFTFSLFLSDTNIESLKFVVREDADSLVVAANGKTGSLFEIWELSEKKLNIHSMFSSTCTLDETTEEPSKTYVCTHFLFRIFTRKNFEEE